MSEDVATTLQQILSKLQKLDTIESAIKSIEVKLQNLETRTQRLESSESTAKQEREQLNERIRSTKDQVNDRMKEVKERQDVCETNAEHLKQKVRECQKQMDEMHTKNLYLEAYSRRENIKFMNIEERKISADQREDTEEVLRQFLERYLGYKDAREAEIQRVHRMGKGRNGGPRPILARFLRY